ncbi:MAG TPA: dihydroorotase, partial [Clostridiaceae bacterium]|nr:dihydroorotase [Clostridiaceae bacterium]
VSKGLQGKELAEIGLMKEAGIVAVSDDGAPVRTADMTRKGMVYANDFDLVVINHCEDPSLADGFMNEGYNSTKMGVRGVPAAAEDIMVARDLILAEYLDLPVHLAHISTHTAVAMIRDAKQRGVKVTCETCPHYFVLTDDACLNFNTYARVNPPLRRPEDVKAIIAGLCDGTIDMIATDHAPHHEDEKDVPFDQANNGFIGFETAFALGYTYLVQPGHLTLAELVEKMSLAPATMLKIGRGTLEIGKPADVTIVDVAETWVVDRFRMASKSANTPYHGMTLTGKVKATLVDGKVVFNDELC